MKLGDFFAEIVINKRALEEYQHKGRKARNRVECWIPSSRGDSFEIYYGLLPGVKPLPELCLAAEIHVDGKYVGEFIDDEGLCASIPYMVISGWNEKDGSGLVSPFHFTQRRFTDNAREAEPVDGICTIKVILEWKRWVEQAVSTSELVEQPDLSRPIHGDKAEVLCSLDAVELGPPRPDAHFPGLPDPSFVSESAGLKPEVFMFHYASRDWLKNENVTLVAPSRKRPTLDDPIDVLSSESDSEIMEEAPQPPPNKKTKVEPEDTKIPAPTPNPSDHSNALQNKRARLNTHAQQLRTKAGVRSAVEPDQAGSEDTRNADHLLSLQLSQLADEYHDLINQLIQARSTSSSPSSDSIQTEVEKLKSRGRKLNQRVSDLEDSDAKASQDDRLLLILAFGQLVKALEDLAGGL